MSQRQRDNPGLRRKLLVSSLISLVLVGITVFLLVRRGDNGPGDGALLGRGPGGEQSSPALPAGDATAESDAKALAGAEKAKEDEKAAPEEPLPPPLLHGRVTGEGAGIEGAAVNLFSTKSIERAIERLEDLAPQGGEMPDIEGIALGLREELEKFRASAVTSKSVKDGAYEVRGVEPGSYFVLTLADGRLFRYGDVVNLATDRSETLDLALDRGASIAGRVVNASGDGVAGATVIAEFRPGGMAGVGLVIRRLLRYVNGEFLKGPFQAVSGPDGAFTISSLPPGVYDVAASKVEGVEARLPQVETGTSEAVIYLGAPCAIKGSFATRDGAAASVPFLLERQDDVVQLPMPIGGFDKIANTVNRFVSGGPKKGVSNAKGEFGAAPLAPGKYRLSVETRGVLPFLREFELDWGEAADLGILQLDRGATIAGIVKGADGRPIEGAKVLATPAKPNFMIMGSVVNDFVTGRASATTNDSGAFRLGGLVRGKYQVVATAPGHAAAAKQGVETDGEPIALDLKPGARITGRVIAAHDGAPIPNARVRARETRGRTDAEGRFTLDGVSPKGVEGSLFVGMQGSALNLEGATPKTAVDVHAGAEGFIGSEGTIDLASGKMEIEIALEKAPEIAGVVLDPDGQPAPGSLVRLTPAIPEEMPFDFFDTGMIFFAAGVTDLEGKFKLASFKGADENGRYRVIADHVLYSRGASEAFPLQTKSEEKGKTKKDEPGELQITLVRGGKVTGIVTDGTKPVPGATVRLAKAPKKDKGPVEQFGMFLSMIGLPKGGDLAYTGREGRFEYSRVTPGDYLVSAEVAGFTDSPAQPVTIAPGDEREVTLSVDPGGEIAGTVADPASMALANARVRLFRDVASKDGKGNNEERQFLEAQKLFGGSYKSVRTAEDGSFRFQGLQEGTYTVSAEYTGYVRREVAGVAPGKVDERIVLEPAASLAGIVADMGNGLPITRFHVRVTRDGEGGKEAPGPFNPGDREYSDAEGRFARDDLEAGKHVVKVTAQGFAPASREVFLTAGGRIEERFPLAQAGSIRGVVVDKATQMPVAGARISLSGLARSRARSNDGAQAEGVEKVSDRRSARLRKQAEDRSARQDAAGAADPQSGDQRAMNEYFTEEWAPAESTTSGEDGGFLLEGVPEGPQRVIVTHGEYVPLAQEGVEAPAGQEIELSFAIAAGLTISGKLRDSAGNPASNRFVFARGASQENAHVRKSVNASPTGEFRLSGLEKGTYRLIAPPQGVANAHPVPVIIELTQSQSDLNITVSEE